MLGAERTLVAWEEHDAFVPVGDEPRCAWVDRDEVEIAKLVRLATALIDELHRRTTWPAAPASESGCRARRSARAVPRPRARRLTRRPVRESVADPVRRLASAAVPERSADARRLAVAAT